MTENTEARYYRLREAEMQTRERHRELAMANMAGMTEHQRRIHLDLREVARLEWQQAEREYLKACLE